MAAPAPTTRAAGHGFTLRDGQVVGKRIEEGHVVLGLFGTSGDGFLEVLCPLAPIRDLVAEVCDMCEVGDVAAAWDGIAPDPSSGFPTLHRLASVTIGSHEDGFTIPRGRIAGKRLEGNHVVLDLSGGSNPGALEVLCPFRQPDDLLAVTCDMIEVGDVGYLWDGAPPDPASDFPTAHRLTSVTLGTSVYWQLFADGFESGDLSAWSSQP